MSVKIRLLIEKYDMNVTNVMSAWNGRINKNEELVRLCEQVKEWMRAGIPVFFNDLGGIKSQISQRF